MFKKWFGRGSRSDIFELLTEELTQQDTVVLGDDSAAHLGQLEAMPKARLIAYADRQSRRIKQFSTELAQLHRQMQLYRQRDELRDTSKEASKQLAQIERRREREAQFQRDQFQIRMKELSMRVADLEGQLLRTQAENSRLIDLLRSLRALSRCSAAS